MTAPTLFDIIDLPTETGIRQAERNADQSWKDAASAAVRVCVAAGDWFTTDDVWDLLEAVGIEGGANPSAMGPVMQAFQGRGEIAKTTLTRRSTRGKTHRSLTVWRPA